MRRFFQLKRQKPAKLSHDDEIMIRQLTEYFTTRKGLQNTDATYVEWLRDLKEKLTHVKQTPAEWSEEDNAYIESICAIIKRENKLYNNCPDVTDYNDRLISWLKSLKSMYQKQE